MAEQYLSETLKYSYAAATFNINREALGKECIRLMGVLEEKIKFYQENN